VPETNGGAAGVDLEALIAELKRDAERLRAETGATRLPPFRSQAEALLAVGTDPTPSPSGAAEHRASNGIGQLRGPELATLSALADPGDAEFRSHRQRLGGAVLAAKRLLRRLLTPILDRQAAFNRATLHSFERLESDLVEQLRLIARRLDELDRHVVTSADRIAALERRMAAVPELDALGEGDFDYLAFEAAFRGSRDHVRRTQARYLDYLRGDLGGPVVDLGCGRGEFLELLREAGISAYGVEQNSSLVAHCRAAGLDVRQNDVIAALKESPDASLGAVLSFQVVEHLGLPRVVELLGLARRKLRPGGCFIAETVNVASLITFARAWSIDPTHNRPLHPLTLRFLVDHAGFQRSELVFGSEVAPDTRLEEEEGSDSPAARNAARVNEIVFGPQDYAVVAWA
jgi:O-antigen chain-terminating methyltransferase